MPASVVDLPEPVGPVTSTRPRGSMHRSRKILGDPSSSRLRITEGILRNTAPAPRFWLKALTRKRASLGISKEKSVSKNSSNAFLCLSFMMSYTMLCTSLWASAGMLTRFMSPSTRIIGGTPADKCRSEALFFTANARSCAISTAIRTPCERHGLRQTQILRERESGLRLAGIIAEGFGYKYVNGSAEFAGKHPPGARTHRFGGRRLRPTPRFGHTPRGHEVAAARDHPGSRNLGLVPVR